MKKHVQIILQIILFIVIHRFGVMLGTWFSLPIPGNVLGMLLLFFLLWSRIIPLQWVERAANLLTKHLAFFFIPIAVGMMTLGSLFITSGLSLLVVLFLSTFIGLIFSGYFTQFFMAKKEEIHADSHHHSI